MTDYATALAMLTEIDSLTGSDTDAALRGKTDTVREFIDSLWSDASRYRLILANAAATDALFKVFDPQDRHRHVSNAIDSAATVGEK